MSINVAELLAEPQLGLTMLAGAAGLENRITWAHTSDLPRLWEWVTGGELMMTNGLSIPADAAGQVALAEALVAAGASALAIGEKMHAPALCPEFLSACDSLPLPLLNIPFPLPFIAIARSVAESSLLEESQRLRQTARIYDLLRLEGASREQWRSLLDDLAANLEATIFVVDRGCLHPWHPDGDELPADLSAELEPLLHRPSEASRKFQWHRLAGGLDVVTMDIPTHRDAVLVVLPTSAVHPDAVVLLHAATVLGLAMARATLTVESQRRSGAEFLQQAFDGRLAVAEFDRRLTEFRIAPEKFVVASLSSSDRDSLTDVHIGLWRHGVDAIGLRRPATLHLIVSPEGAAGLLRHAVSADLRIGVSRPTDAAGLDRALQESLWALGTAQSNSAQFMRYSDGPSWLGLTSFEEGKALVERLLGAVIEYENGHQPDLIITLTTFLDCQRSWQKTATTLFVHRQTIVYRMHKIGELTGLDMAETSTLAQLWFALQIRTAMDAHGPSGAISTPPR